MVIFGRPRLFCDLRVILAFLGVEIIFNHFVIIIILIVFKYIYIKYMNVIFLNDDWNVINESNTFILYCYNVIT